MVLREQMQVPIILLSQVVNGIMLPFVLIFMLRLSNREDLMGAYKNTRTFNAIAWVTCVVMIILTVLLLARSSFTACPPERTASFDSLAIPHRGWCAAKGRAI